jgi:uncharacterized paraquat-inducible protein A
MPEQERRALFRSDEEFTRFQKAKCPVCGHRTVSIVRHSLNWVLVALLGAALMYIVMDVAHGGRLDGSILRAIHESRQSAR